MQPEVYLGGYYEIETTEGTEIVPADVCSGETAGDFDLYVTGSIRHPAEHVEQQTGWLARMQAPGYMDCTEWGAYDSEEEAMDALAEYYGDDEADAEADNQLPPWEVYADESADDE